MGVLDDTYDGVRCVVGVLFHDVVGGVGCSMGDVTMGEFQKRGESKVSIESLIMSRWKELWINLDDIEEAKKEFPFKTLNFFDARYTEECEDFRKQIYQWFNKWFGSEDK